MSHEHRCNLMMEIEGNSLVYVAWAILSIIMLRIVVISRWRLKETHLFMSHEQHKAGSQAVPMPHKWHLLWLMQNLKWRSFVFLESVFTFLQMAAPRWQPGSAHIELIFRSQVFILWRFKLISILSTVKSILPFRVIFACLDHKRSREQHPMRSLRHKNDKHCETNSEANI